MKRLKELNWEQENIVILDWLKSLSNSNYSYGLVLDKKDSDPRNFWNWAKREGIEASPAEVARVIERMIMKAKVSLYLTPEGPMAFQFKKVQK